MKLLTTGNPKIAKGEKLGFLTAILHLAPARLSGFNVCPMATKGCEMACLNTAGRGGMVKIGETTNMIQEARIRKTLMFFNERDAFVAQLVKEIGNFVKLAAKYDLTPAVRLNGTSDIRWETVNAGDFDNLMDMFPTVQFYDYTKIPNRRNLPANYHLTFSKADGNDEHVHTALANGLNVAVVFRNGEAPVKVTLTLAQQLAGRAKREAARARKALRPFVKSVKRPRVIDMTWLPATYAGFAVVNGDGSDLRFLDVTPGFWQKLFGIAPRPVIVGLKAKGEAKYDTSGFVVSVNTATEESK